MNDPVRHLAWAELDHQSAWVHSARIFYRPGKSAGLHDHDFAEVFWIEAGQLTQLHPEGDRLLTTGDLVCLRPEHRHGFRSQQAAVMVNIAFPSTTLDHLDARYGHADHYPWHAQAVTTIHHLSNAQLHALGETVDQLSRGEADNIAVDALLLQIMAAIAKDPARHWFDRLPPWLAACMVELEQPPLLTEGLPGLVARSGRSREHIARTLRRCLDRSPTDLLTELRCRWAARELALSDRSIQDIALSCGLNNLSHFYRVFKAQYGCPPRQYRQRCRQAAS